MNLQWQINNLRVDLGLVVIGWILTTCLLGYAVIVGAHERVSKRDCATVVVDGTEYLDCSRIPNAHQP